MDIKISVCTRKTDRVYKNQEQTWQYIKDRNRNPVRTTETAEEYPKLSKDRRDNLKDHGGFVGGWLKKGIRKNGNIIGRTIGCLDADNIPKGIDFPALVEVALPDTEYFLYSTHSHTPQTPRYRLVILFSREVSEEEYPAALRQTAKQIGIDYFDDTTYQANRMMYWASCPSNGEFVFEENDGEPLDPDSYLSLYEDWRDVTQWPTSTRQSEVIKREVGRQQDPLAKEGTVGAFCRAYTVEDAISEFLPEIYELSAVNGRYDYIPADSSAGVVLYESKWVYSHHATDPACGRLLNAFDLVRIHRFGDKDEKTSFKLMSDFAVANEKVKVQFAEERKSQAADDFDDKVDGNWETRLELEKNGKVKDTLDNIVLILDNDPKVSVVGYNELKSSVDFLDKPAWEPIKFPSWTDNDTSQLRVYLSYAYGIYSPQKTADALNKVAAKRKHHPIREYLNGLPVWDGVKRAETLLIDYLGAEDTGYVRAVTRKTIVAAVARVFVPGIKFDSILVMDGPQDKGKSTLFNKLAGDEWFNDGLTLTDMQDKTGAEKLQGYWIMEIGELTGMRKSDIDSVKSFISRRDDKYRASYGRMVESHPRQSIIVATVNSMGGFLRDPTGNRRFWPVQTPGGSAKHSWDISNKEVKQIWAEAVHLWKQGEKLYLEGTVKEAAAMEQNAAIETDPREGMVRDYLDRLLPEGWEDYDLGARRDFFHGGDFGKPNEGTVPREFVCPHEIWSECFGRELAACRKQDSYEITTILRKIGWVQAEAQKRVPIYGKQRVWNRA